MSKYDFLKYKNKEVFIYNKKEKVKEGALINIKYESQEDQEHEYFYP